MAECEEIAQALKGRAKIEGQHGTPAAETLSGKAAEAITWLLAEIAIERDDWTWGDAP